MCTRILYTTHTTYMHVYRACGSTHRHTHTCICTLNMTFRLTSDGDGMQNMLKWRMNLGVTGLRPPPGGAQAAQMVTSWQHWRNKNTQSMHVHMRIVVYVHCGCNQHGVVLGYKQRHFAKVSPNTMYICRYIRMYEFSLTWCNLWRNIVTD